jgi:hypothetical protein
MSSQMTANLLNFLFSLASLGSLLLLSLGWYAFLLPDGQWYLIWRVQVDDPSFLDDQRKEFYYGIAGRLFCCGPRQQLLLGRHGRHPTTRMWRLAFDLLLRDFVDRV